MTWNGWHLHAHMHLEPASFRPSSRHIGSVSAANPTGFLHDMHRLVLIYSCPRCAPLLASRQSGPTCVFCKLGLHHSQSLARQRNYLGRKTASQLHSKPSQTRRLTCKGCQGASLPLKGSRNSIAGRAPVQQDAWTFQTRG